ncbi:UNVERIFIED_CONTAM: hypothetical protein Sindi_1306000 [Sesamum indicum]
MEGFSRRNNRDEETPRGGGSMLHLTKDELQRMIEEASKKAIVEYERRTSTPVQRETSRRQLFESRELRREFREPSEPERRSRRPTTSEAGSSSHARAKGREPVISPAEVESVGKQIDLLGKQIDELKKRVEIVAHNKNSPFSNDILVESGPIMAKLFATTLAGKTQEWFTSLPHGSIDSYEQLIQKFSFHFASKKKQKRSATHFFNIRQGEGETLKSFMGRFNNETLEVQDLRIYMMVNILIHGLKKGSFTWALARDPPIDVEQLMALA